MTESPLARKLSSFIDLSAQESAEVETWSARTMMLDARKTLIKEGDPTSMTCLVLSGWAYRYKDLPNGKRQIVGLLLPGDMCDLQSFLLKSADHSLATLCAARVALIPGDVIRGSIERQPRLGLALWWSTLVDEGIAREWLLSIGQREALERVAALFCELLVRAKRVGLVVEGSFVFPCTQTDLGEILGLTSVHINRMLRLLREKKLMTFKGGQIVVSDGDALAALAGFRPAYLQLERRHVHGTRPKVTATPLPA